MRYPLFVSLLLVFSFSAPAFAAEPKNDCPSCGNVTKHKYSDRDNAIGLLINDMNASDNKLKTADQIEKYHRCLLSSKAERSQSRSYEDSYRHQIAVANESFNVPIGMLTCLCGRESRFDARSSAGESSARGICQSLSESLSDVKRWIATIPALKTSWEAYVARLGNKIEHPDCATQPLSSEVLMRCPSLGLGVASVYLSYVYSRVEKGGTLTKNQWDAQGLNTIVAVAGSYFAGPGFADKAMKKSSNRARWPAALMEEQCVFAKEKNKDQKWIDTRLSTLRNHMVSIRNCVQADNWLDHQGKAMLGECASPTHAQRLQELEQFRASLPMSCTP